VPRSFQYAGLRPLLAGSWPIGLPIAWGVRGMAEDSHICIKRCGNSVFTDAFPNLEVHPEV
jgi:hypothetical protein